MRNTRWLNVRKRTVRRKTERSEECEGMNGGEYISGALGKIS